MTLEYGLTSSSSSSSFRHWRYRRVCYVTSTKEPAALSPLPPSPFRRRPARVVASVMPVTRGGVLIVAAIATAVSTRTALASTHRVPAPAVGTPPTCAGFASDFFKHIWSDFEPLAAHGPITVANMTDLLERVRQYEANAFYFVEVAVIGGSLFVKADPSRLGVWQGAVMRMVALTLERHGRWIPDVHFVVSVLDEPYLERRRDQPLPLFSAVSTTSHWDIPVPANAFFDKGGISSSGSSEDFLKWEGEDFQRSLDKQHPWEKKRGKAFFRGHDWESINSWIENLPGRPAEPCVSTVTSSLTNSFGYRRWYEELSSPGEALADLLDVGLTGAPDFYMSKRKAKNFAKPVSIPDHAAHKYLLHLDGAAHSTRLVKLLTLGCVVLKQESPYFEYFYRNLRPYEHYIPISRDRCSHDNLTAAIRWLRSHDEEARRIASNARQIQRELLTISAATCYWQRLLAVYGGLQAFDPRFAVRLSEFKPWPKPS
eukprot:TRINITY_DN48463_c0_g1_i1.p1 TRINITY_DN48463_c0_g1~~TRINITY_DN48463_c0_g1_i1.p1  ORF type:complete len:485 (-),score=52.81 TRINITY_DN48463_c0_g1_i1:33-1487(-)